MLSYLDIKRELGQNIYIYPVFPSSIKANSIDLHVSKFGWSLKTKKSIRTSENHLTIPANDTALIYTKESIYVSHRIGGSFHSKVTLVSKGLGHIGTALDAQYVGNCLIAIHNHSTNPVKLTIGQEFVTLHLFYLNTPCFEKKIVQDNSPGHKSMISGMEEKSVQEYMDWRDDNKWNVSSIELLHKMLESSEYQQCKREYEVELKEFGKNRFWHIWKNVFIAFLSCIAFLFLLAIPAYWVECGFSALAKTILEDIACPIAVSIITVFLTKTVLEHHKRAT